MKILTCLILLLPLSAWSAPPPDYYLSAHGSSGQSLKSALHAIIDGQQPLPYTSSGNDDWHDHQDIDVWEALTYTDSAFESTQPTCGLIQLLYLNKAVPLSDANRGAGNHDSWDREHVWPKSRGFARKSQDGYTDLHHLRPADRNINSAHSNFGYDVGGAPVIDKHDDGTTTITTAKVDRDNESFEPTDRAKGQVARMIFYMAVRYEVGDDEGNEKMPDLKLTQSTTRSADPVIGSLCTLLKWHNQFGPTDFERRRNDRVMEMQGNRNPFIDEPGWANLIWGGACSFPHFEQ